MNLLKKISRAATIGILGIGILAGCKTIDANDMAKPEIQSEIGKEAERYKNLIISAGNDGNFYFRWKYIHANGVLNTENVYSIEHGGQPSRYKLGLIKSWADRNNNGVEDEGEVFSENREYQTFILDLPNKDRIILGRDENNDGRIDKMYTYRLKGRIIQPEDKKPLAIYDFGLVKIQKDVNNDGKFADKETLWEGKLSPSAKTSDILSQQ